MKLPLAEGGALVVGTGVNGLAAYLFIALGTRAYGAEAFAPVSVLWSFWAVSVAVVAFPVQHWMIRRIRLDGHDGGVRAALPQLSGLVLAVTASQVIVAWTLRGELFGDQRPAWPAMVAAVALGSAWTGLVRGGLAGRRRFYAAAAMIACENLLRLVAGLAAVCFSDHVIWFAGALALGPLVGLIWPEVLRFSRLHGGRDSTLAFVGGLAGGTLIAQVVLNAGPAVLSLLGGTGAEITALFAGLALFRAPYLLALGPATRITGPLTGLVAEKNYGLLRRIVYRIALLTAGGTALGALVSHRIGTELLRLIFGADVVLPPPVVAGVAAGSVLALGTLALTLVLIARSGTAIISLAWTVALGVGAVVVLVAPGDPLPRVVVALVASVLVAFAWMLAAQVLWNLRVAAAEDPPPALP